MWLMTVEHLFMENSEVLHLIGGLFKVTLHRGSERNRRAKEPITQRDSNP